MMTDMFRNPAEEVDARSFAGLGAGASLLASRVQQAARVKARAAGSRAAPTPRGTARAARIPRPVTSRQASGVLAQQAVANLLRPGAAAASISPDNVPPLQPVLNRAAETQTINFFERDPMPKEIIATLSGMTPVQAASLGALGIPKWMRKVGRSIDPTRKGSLTYAAASKYVGEQNLQTAAAIGQGIKSQIGGKTPVGAPVLTAAQQAEIERANQQGAGDGAQTVLMAGAGLLGAVLVFTLIRRSRRAMAPVAVAGL